MDLWIGETAAAITARAIDDLRTLVDISSPSRDRDAAERAVVAAQALAPPQAVVERLPCSSPDHADDLLLTLTGTGRARVLLVGHVDTVVAHAEHRPLVVTGDRLDGSGTIDMKGGDVLALGLLRALVAVPERYATVALLLVVDEEWRTDGFAHGPRFAGFDACLCFEGAQRDRAGTEAVVVRRKAATTLRVIAHGASAHSGSNPDRGANALLALAEAAQIVARHHAPAGPQALTAVPTILRSGASMNVVPAHGELLCDMRAYDAAAFEPVLASIATTVDGVTLDADLIRLWPGMDARESAAPVIERAAAALGYPLVGGQRGGASDASHFAPHVAVTIDGLGPLGGGAHSPEEFVDASTLETRAQIACAITDAVLDPPD